MNNNQNSVIVVAGIVDGQKLKLYLKDGSIREVNQGNENLVKILEIITGPCSRGEEAIVPAEMLDARPLQMSGFKEYEKKSRFVRFVNVARSALNALQDLFKPETQVKDQVIGKIPTLNQDAKAQPTSREEMFDKLVNEVMTHAVPIVPGDLDEPDDGSKGSDPIESRETTLVAVTPEGILPNAQGLIKVINHNIETNSNTTGIDNLIKRLTKVAKDRRHSAEDFVGFLQRSDLAVASDGSIMAYKMLNYYKTANGVRYFKDIHSGQVVQRVGSLVMMNPSLVDPNRNKDCSNGLHVARRGYLRSFSGSVCVLIRILPEDAIAVPAYNRDKMRVCAYHIIFELPPEDVARVRIDKPMAEPASLAALKAAMEGNFPDPVEIVEICGEMGTKLNIRPFNTPEEDKAKVAVSGEDVKNQIEKAADTKEAPVITQVTGSILTNQDVEQAKSMPITPDMAGVVPDSVSASTAGIHELKAPVVNPKDVAKAVKQSKPTRQDEAKKLWAALTKDGSVENAKALADYKRKVKVSWEVLGLEGGKVQPKLNKILGSSKK